MSGRRGHPPFIPTREQRWTVQVLRSHGVPMTVIASNITLDGRGIDVKTLKKAFAVELRTGFEQVKAAIGASVVKSALAGNVAAQKYWLMCWGGPEWRPPVIAPGDEVPGAAHGATTIIIKGGLPEIVHPAMPGEEADEERKTNGSGQAH